MGTTVLEHHFHRCEPAVDEVGAVGERRRLPAAPAGGGQECFGVLVVVVVAGAVGFVADGRRDDFARRQAGPIVDRDHADDVVVHFRFADLARSADHHRLEAVALRQLLVPRLDRARLLFVENLIQAVGPSFGHDNERGGVDGVDALAQDGPLAAALAVLGLLARPDQKRMGILEVIALDHAGERLARRQRQAVAGVDVTDLSLRHRDQRRHMDAVLPAPVAEVQAAAEEVGLVAGFAVQGNDAAVSDRPLRRPEFLDDANLVVGNDADGQPPDEHQHQERGESNQGIRDDGFGDFTHCEERDHVRPYGRRWGPSVRDEATRVPVQRGDGGRFRAGLRG